ncbi:MAG: HlyD family efflux transporter periplasmic adaptor subunit [Nonlabens sp.]
MRKIVLSIIAVALLIAAIFGAKYLKESKQAPKSKPKKEYKIVAVDTVENATIPIEVNANGNLVAKKRIQLFSEVSGVFKSTGKLYRAGQQYKKGETIISIDNSEFYAQVQSARSNLNNQITALMPDLRLDYPDSYRQWQDYLKNWDLNKSLSNLPEPVNDQEKYFITGRNIYSSYYEIKNLENRLSKHRIRAPFDGTLTEALVSEGTLIRNGQQLGEFIGLGEFELQISLSADSVEMIELGLDVNLTTNSGNKVYPGVVSRINARVDQATQTVLVVVETSHPDLKEGMYVTAILNASEIQDAIELPRSLLSQNNQVFEVKDGMLHGLMVQPVHFTEGTVVLKNIPDGAVLLSQSIPGSYEGMLVKTEEQAQAEQAKSGEKTPKQ